MRVRAREQGSEGEGEGKGKEEGEREREKERDPKRHQHGEGGRLSDVKRFYIRNNGVVPKLHPPQGHMWFKPGRQRLFH